MLDRTGPPAAYHRAVRQPGSSTRPANLIREAHILFSGGVPARLPCHRQRHAGDRDRAERTASRHGRGVQRQPLRRHLFRVSPMPSWLPSTSANCVTWCCIATNWLPHHHGPGAAAVRYRVRCHGLPFGTDRYAAPASITCWNRPANVPATGETTVLAKASKEGHRRPHRHHARNRCRATCGN